MVPCGSSPVTRFALASAKRENEAPEEEAGALLYPPDKSLREREIYPMDSFIYLLNNWGQISLRQHSTVSASAMLQKQAKT